MTNKIERVTRTFYLDEAGQQHETWEDANQTNVLKAMRAFVAPRLEEFEASDMEPFCLFILNNWVELAKFRTQYVQKEPTTPSDTVRISYLGQYDTILEVPEHTGTIPTIGERFNLQGRMYVVLARRTSPTDPNHILITVAEV